MKQEVNLIRARLKTPRAAAVAGPIFCSPDYGPFIVTAFGPCRSARGGPWLQDQCQHSRSGAEPGAPSPGIAFLWFIGVLSDRLGELEDRFFATVFLGSGFLFLVFAAVAGGIILAYAARPSGLLAKSSQTAFESDCNI